MQSNNFAHVGYLLFDEVDHLRSFVFNALLSILDVVLEFGVLGLEQFELLHLIGFHTALQPFELVLHVLDLVLLVLQILVIARNNLVLLDVVSVLFEIVGLALEGFDVVLHSLFGIRHLLQHQGDKLLLVYVQLRLEVLSELGGYFASVDVQSPLRYVLYLVLDLDVPVVEKLDLLLNLIEGDVVLLPVRQHELFHKSNNFPHFLVVLLNEHLAHLKVFGHLLLHLFLHLDVLYRPSNDLLYICNVVVVLVHVGQLEVFPELVDDSRY